MARRRTFSRQASGVAIPLAMMAMLGLGLAGSASGQPHLIEGRSPARATTPSLVPGAESADRDQAVIAVRGDQTTEGPHKVLESISADAPDDVWAVGIAYEDGDTAAPLTMRWDGHRWKEIPSSPPGLVWPALVDVAALAPDDVWAVGDRYTNNSTANLIMHWDGTSWSVVPSPQPAGQYLHLGSVNAVSPTQVYAAGIVCQSGEGDCAPEVLRWNGHKWTLVQRPPASQLTDVSASSPSDAFEIGRAGSQQLSAHWDGTQWKPVDVPSTQFGDVLYDVSDAGSDATWAVGTQLDGGGHQAGGYILRWSGTKWKPVDPADASASSFEGVSASSADNAWIVGGSDSEHWDGSSLESVANPLQTQEYTELISVQTLAIDDAWMLGSYSGVEGDVYALLHYDGTRWKVVRRIGTTSTSATADVTAVSTTDAWTVGGKQTNLYTGRSTISHWNGTRWAPVAHPTPGGMFDYLNSVDANAASDVWAVGERSDAKYNYTTLIEHWDGSAWTVVPSPNRDVDQNFLDGVSADSRTDAWAIGSTQTSTGDDQRVLAEHWDGSAWHIVGLPHGVYRLAGVDARSPTDAWAIGLQKVHQNYAAVVMHWDGAQWRVVHSQLNSDNVSINYLSVVTAGANDVWVVGDRSQRHHSGGKPEIPLVLHWDGAVWSDLQTPTRPSPQSYFAGVSTDQAGGLWVAGYEYDHEVDQGLPLIEHWDGTEWTVSSIARPQPGLRLFAVSAGGPSDAWSLGVNPDRSMLLHWNGSTWRH